MIAVQPNDIERIVDKDAVHAAMRRTKKNWGYIVAFSFGKGAYEEAAALKSREGIEIVLLTVDDLLSKGAV